MIRSTHTEAIRAALRAREEIALFDVREEAIFAEAHPLFAASLPLGRIEVEILDRVPRFTTRIVVYDDGEGLAQRAVAGSRALATSRCRHSKADSTGWRRAGGELFRDVNVPSKAFGELVESQRHTPSISAAGPAGAHRCGRRPRRARRPPFRRVPDDERANRGERAGRRIGLPGRDRGAASGDPGGGELRRADPQHHRCAVAAECRHSQPGGRAPQRHDRLEARRSDARARSVTPGAGGRHGAACARRPGSATRRRSRRRPVCRVGAGGRVAGPARLRPPTASMSERPTSTRPHIRAGFARRRADNWCRRPTSWRRCVAPASCCGMTPARVRI